MSDKIEKLTLFGGAGAFALILGIGGMAYLDSQDRPDIVIPVAQTDQVAAVSDPLVSGPVVETPDVDVAPVVVDVKTLSPEMQAMEEAAAQMQADLEKIEAAERAAATLKEQERIAQEARDAAAVKQEQDRLAQIAEQERVAEAAAEQARLAQVKAAELAAEAARAAQVIAQEQAAELAAQDRAKQAEQDRLAQEAETLAAEQQKQANADAQIPATLDVVSRDADDAILQELVPDELRVSAGEGLDKKGFKREIDTKALAQIEEEKDKQFALLAQKTKAKEKAKARARKTAVTSGKPQIKTKTNLKTQSSGLTKSERGSVASDVRKCWSVLTEYRTKSSTPITVRVALNKQGFINSSARFVGGGRENLSAARQAITRCQPYKLPAAKYGSWKSLTFTFSPKSVSVR